MYPTDTLYQCMSEKVAFIRFVLCISCMRMVMILHSKTSTKESEFW